EQQAREKHRVKVFESRFRPMKLSLTDSQERTLMKLVVDADSDRVLGCHMIGPEAGEIIQGLAVAMKAGASKRDFDETLGIHPTAAEECVPMRTPRDGKFASIQDVSEIKVDKAEDAGRMHGHRKAPSSVG